eukprot:gene3167-5483_t
MTAVNEDYEKFGAEATNEIVQSTTLEKIKKFLSRYAIEFYLSGFFFIGILSVIGMFFAFLYLPHPKNPPIIRGVNLGGWFVLEPWITPSLFENQMNGSIVDEYTFSKVHGFEKSKLLLENHWKTWVTEKEIQELSSYGINHVRIPIGYWMFDVKPEEPWISTSLPYLLTGLKWLKQSNIRVILDLHGAPGGQNGFDNSGVRGKKEWSSPENGKRTIAVLSKITKIFSKSDFHGVVVGINIINEPFQIDLELLRDFYKLAVLTMKKVSENPNLSLTISDGFQKLSTWENFEINLGTRNLFLDSHIYHVFDYKLLNFTNDQHVTLTCETHKPLIKRSNKFIDTYIGEWSLARTDCTKWLNGYGRGSRFDGTFESTNPIGSCTLENNYKQWSTEYKEWMKRFVEVQMDSYEAGVGWFFWNFKAENSPHWDYLLGVREGWIPKNPAKRTHKC